MTVKQRAFPSLRELLTSAFKDSRRILMLMSLTIAVTIISAMVVVPTYTAGSTLLVLLSPEYAYRPEAGSEAFVNIALERDAILNSEISILTSVPMKKEVISKIGIAKIYPDLVGSGDILRSLKASLLAVLEQEPQEPDLVDAAVTQFSQDLIAFADKSGSTIEVGFRNKDPKIAAEVVNMLVQTYLAKRQGIYSDVQSDLVQKQADKLRVDLDRASADLNAYQTRSGIADFTTQLDILLRQQGDLQRTLQQNETAIVDATERLAIAKAQLAKTPAQIVQYSDNESDRRVQVARDSLAELKQREADLRQTYTDNSDKVVGIRSQIKAMETQIHDLQSNGQPSAVRRGLNDVYATLDLDRLRAESALAAANRQEVAIKAQLQNTNSNIENLYEKKAGLEERQRQKALLEQNYANVIKTLDERKMQESVEAKKTANVRIVQAAEVPTKPAPIRLVILVGGLIISLLIALVTAFLSDIFRRGFISAERIERSLGIRVLASVSPSDSVKQIIVLANRGRLRRI